MWPLDEISPTDWDSLVSVPSDLPPSGGSVEPSSVAQAPTHGPSASFSPSVEPLASPSPLQSSPDAGLVAVTTSFEDAAWSASVLDHLAVIEVSLVLVVLCLSVVAVTSLRGRR